MGVSEATPLLYIPTLETLTTLPNGDKSRWQQHPPTSYLSNILQQGSAVVEVALLNLMISIPLGASYFPIGWKADGSDPSTIADEVGAGGDLNGIFPLPGKHALGIRMCLFATIMGQVALTFVSKF